MRKLPFVTSFFLFIFILMPFAGKAQMDSTAYAEFMRAVSKSVRLSVDFIDHGQPTEFALVYTHTKGKRTIRCFPEGIPQKVRRCFGESERVIRDAKWRQIFPGLAASDDFSIAVPFVVRIENDPNANSFNEGKTAEERFNIGTKVAPPYRVCDPVIVTLKR